MRIFAVDLRHLPTPSRPDYVSNIEKFAFMVTLSPDRCFLTVYCSEPARPKQFRPCPAQDISDFDQRLIRYTDLFGI